MYCICILGLHIVYLFFAVFVFVFCFNLTSEKKQNQTPCCTNVILILTIRRKKKHYLRFPNLPYLHVFALWKEVGVSIEKSCTRRENMLTRNRMALDLGSNPQPSRCEAVVVTNGF